VGDLQRPSVLVIRAWLGAAALVAAAIAAPSLQAGRHIAPPSEGTLSIRSASRGPWWRLEAAPIRWTRALPEVSDAVRWRSIAPGLEVGELQLSGVSEVWRLRVVLARLDPRLYHLALAARVEHRTMHPWAVDLADPAAALAVNAGQFTDNGPWGWVVHRGRELQAPGAGPLSMAVAIDTAGAVTFASAESISVVRARGGIAEALQSYPALLVGDGDVPPALRVGARAIDLAHRDARLALGELRDGRLLLALTRFEGAGGALSELPFGPTVPEMVAIMGALGCRKAVSLDGGISGQLLVRDSTGRAQAWRGLRNVPLGLIALPTK
jgi:hypothetical protein